MQMRHSSVAAHLPLPAIALSTSVGVGSAIPIASARERSHSSAFSLGSVIPKLSHADLCADAVCAFLDFLRPVYGLGDRHTPPVLSRITPRPGFSMPDAARSPLRVGSA